MSERTKKASQEPEVKSAAFEETVGMNELTKKEKEDGWVLFFNGKTTNVAGMDTTKLLFLLVGTLLMEL